MTETMPAAQLKSLKELIRDIMGRYGTLRLRRHKDVGSTDCPGINCPWAEAQKYNETEEDEEMSYEQFKAYMNQYQKEQEKNASVPKSAEKAWPMAKDAGVLDGTMPNAPLTRAQYAVTLQRLGLIGK